MHSILRNTKGIEMKSINAKRIAAVAASLLMGLAFAGTGGVTWSNIPIISNSGQPVVQVVVGSGAMPSDGVVAANIAAVLGNLAFTSQNVTATPSGLSGVTCVVTTPTCTLSNQQVWFNERGVFSGPSGSYSFTALIGSVLNQAIVYGAPQNTKTLQTGTSYAFTEGSTPFSIQVSPMQSPFGVVGSTPSVSAVQSNAGGLQFLSFRSGTSDNILQVSNAQLKSLLNNWGPNGESEYLWVTGAPVYDQATNNPVTGTPDLAVLGVGGVYQVVFSKPITEPYVQSGNTVNNAALELLGRNWTVLSYTEPSGTVSSTEAVAGGTLQLAASLSALQTIYVGHNITSSNFSVELTDLGQPNSTGASPAAVDVFYKGNLTNVTQLASGSLTKFQVGTHTLYVKVNQTFAGLYAYQKWAKMKLYSNTFTITSGTTFNSTNAGGWNAYLLWTNATSSGKPDQLQSILVANTSSVTLLPDQSFSFVAPNMTAYKFTFVGDTLGTNFDPVQFSTSTASGMWLQNGALTGSVSGDPSLDNISSLHNQPAQLLTVTSQIPGSLSSSSVSASSSLTYDLTPYQLAETGNAVKVGGYGDNVIVKSLPGNANIINPSTPVTVSLWGASTPGGSVVQQPSVTVYTLGPSSSNAFALATQMYNVTDVAFSQPLPGMEVIVENTITPTEILATYEPQGAGTLAVPQLLYTNTNKPYQQMTDASSAPTATYNQQNGPFINGGLQIAAKSGLSVAAGSQEYFTYTVAEYDVPSSTSYTDNVAFGIYNSTNGGVSSFRFQLNESVTGTKNNMTYYSSQYELGSPTGLSSVQVPTGFMTERGTKVASISTSTDTLDMAKAVDTLEFVLAPQAVVVNSSTTTSSIGPVGIGQAVPGFANLTVSAVNATCAFGKTSCSVSGLANVTATPSVSSAVVPVSLNTAANPLVVLDSNANSAATLIVVGSKYVNSVAGQVFAQNPTLNSSFGTSSVVVQAYGTNRILVAGYTANQTVTAGNQFIADLLSSASTP